MFSECSKHNGSFYSVSNSWPWVYFCTIISAYHELNLYKNILYRKITWAENQKSLKKIGCHEIFIYLFCVCGGGLFGVFLFCGFEASLHYSGATSSSLFKVVQRDIKRPGNGKKWTEAFYMQSMYSTSLTISPCILFFFSIYNYAKAFPSSELFSWLC